MRFHELFVRHRFKLLFVVLLHFVLAHYFVIGFASWDGFGHRVPPVVELVKHASLGLDKFDNWALLGFRPFVELVNLPFLAVFGLDGLIFGFALAFPLCVLAVHRFVRELTGDAHAALYASASYVLVPMVNSQLFSGYVDWSIPGLLAFFLLAILRIANHAGRPRWTAYAAIVAATFLFTMSRQQAPYLSVFFFSVVAYLKLVERRGLRLSVPRRTVLLGAIAAFLVGLSPSVTLQVLNYLRHGTPIYPYQFSMLGVTIGQGADFKSLCYYAGLTDFTARGFFRAFVAAWLLPTTWPFCFFDSRNLGGGLFLLFALCTLPFSLRRANVTTRVLLACFVLTSLGGRDFWLPRYAYTLVLAISICSGLALSALLESRRTMSYAAAVAVLGLHLLRPEWDIFRIMRGDAYPRMNASASKLFVAGVFDIPVFPDVNAQLVVAHQIANGFALPLYGRKLTNSVLGSVSKEQIGAQCEGLRAFETKGPNVLVVDDGDLTKDCARRCAIPNPRGRCLAYKLESPTSASREGVPE
jgi:hypothetical protein